MDNILNFIHKFKIESAIVGLCFLLALISLITQKSTSTITTKNHIMGIDTSIPIGHSLIPIEIKNLSQISSLIGDYGVVSVFETGNHNLPIAQGVRLIRSPLDKSHFALLAPQQKSHIILNSKQPFYITILNPKSFSNTFRKKKIRNHSRIQVGI